MPVRRPLAERFWEKVDQSGDCWIWTAARSTAGYGRVGTGIGKQQRQAHRIAYELVVGPIPEGLTLDHLCRNRSCVNPAHLEPVTMKDNLLRGNGWGGVHTRTTHCPKGHPYTEKNTRSYRGRRHCRACAGRTNSKKWIKYKDRINTRRRAKYHAGRQERKVEAEALIARTRAQGPPLEEA